MAFIELLHGDLAEAFPTSLALDRWSTHPTASMTDAAALALVDEASRVDESDRLAFLRLACRGLGLARQRGRRISMNRREAEDIVQALRSGLVPRRGLHHLATGMDALMRAIEQELDFVATGKGTAKWIRGEYGSGKTFATRLLCARARARGFATSEVQISINDTPLHHLETVYRLYQRVSVSFGAEPQFDNLRATQARLSPFDAQRLLEVGRRVRDLYPATQPERVAGRVSDAFLQGLVDKVTAGFGGKVTVAPRVFLRELVDVIDRVEQHDAYDPAAHYRLALDGTSLTAEEISAKEGRVIDDDADDEQPTRARRLDG